MLSRFRFKDRAYLWESNAKIKKKNRNKKKKRNPLGLGDSTRGQVDSGRGSSRTMSDWKKVASATMRRKSRRDDVPLFFLKFKDGIYVEETYMLSLGNAPEYIYIPHTFGFAKDATSQGLSSDPFKIRTSCRHFVSREHNKASQAERYLPPERYLRGPGHLRKKTFDFSPAAMRSPNLSFTLGPKRALRVNEPSTPWHCLSQGMKRTVELCK